MRIFFWIFYSFVLIVPWNGHVVTIWTDIYGHIVAIWSDMLYHALVELIFFGIKLFPLRGVSC